MLLLGDRVVLRSTAPPEAEYVLFEGADIELRTSEPGRVREHGYQTTAADARSRLAQAGFLPRAVKTITRALGPVLARAYARGEAVRRVVDHLGPYELLASASYDPEARAYRGVYLDLAKLARDTQLEHAGATLQALFLTLALEREPGTTAVTLSTDLFTKDGRASARTHKRPAFAAITELENALVRLASSRPAPVITESLSRADVIAFLRERAHAADDDDEAQEVYARLERDVALRERPDRGPLSPPDIWEVELRLESDRHDGLVAAVEALERKYGRTPATTYLHGRVALALRLEHPRVIAERAAALALSLTSFPELSLLAAEAWIDAAEPKRAIPFARDVVDAPLVDEGLLLAAQRLLARAVGAAPDSPSRVPPPRVPSIAPPGPPAPTARPPAPQRESRPPIVLDVPPPPRAPDIVTPVTSFTLDVPGQLTPPPMRSPSAPQRSPREPSLLPPAADEDTPRVPPVAPVVPDLTPHVPSVRPTAPPPAARAARQPQTRPPPDPFGDEPKTLPFSARGTSSPPATSSAPPRRLGGVRVETVAPSASIDPRAEPDETPTVAPIPAQRAPRFDTGGHRGASSSAVPRARTTASEQPAVRTRLATSATARAGASRPAWQLEDPAPPLTRAKLLAEEQLEREVPAEELTVHGAAEDAEHAVALPRSVLEARIAFTRLSRALGREYRTKRGLVLTTGLSGVGSMQATLLELFPQREIATDDQADIVAAHGAFFSEILARTLDAEWADIEGADVMSWSMLVPPDARVWPFARIARLVAMGQRERDLVSTYLELGARAAARRPR